MEKLTRNPPQGNSRITRQPPLANPSPARDSGGFPAWAAALLCCMAALVAAIPVWRLQNLKTNWNLLNAQALDADENVARLEQALVRSAAQRTTAVTKAEEFEVKIANTENMRMSNDETSKKMERQLVEVMRSHANAANQTTNLKKRLDDITAQIEQQKKDYDARQTKAEEERRRQAEIKAADLARRPQLLKDARTAFSTNDYANALKAFLAADRIEKITDNAELFQAGECARNMNSLASAVDFYARVGANSSHYADAQWYTAYASFKQTKSRDGLGFLQRAADAAPPNRQALYYLGLLHVTHKSNFGDMQGVNLVQEWWKGVDYLKRARNAGHKGAAQKLREIGE